MKTAIIGGTGIGEMLRGGEEFSVETEFGAIKGHMRPDGVAVIARHGDKHGIPPHAVPYRAMAAGLREEGFERCLSSGAVGSLRADLVPGTLAAVVDFLDMTGRNVTMFEDSVRHTDFTPGVSADLAVALQAAGAEGGVVYACTNGPRYETPAEVRMLRLLGADVVGMTVATEAVVMRETGIDYGCLAVVTNFAPGLVAGPTSHDEVVASVKASAHRAVEILLQVANS